MDLRRVLLYRHTARLDHHEQQRSNCNPCFSLYVRIKGRIVKLTGSLIQDDILKTCSLHSLISFSAETNAFFSAN